MALVRVTSKYFRHKRFILESKQIHTSTMGEQKVLKDLFKIMFLCSISKSEVCELVQKMYISMMMNSKAIKVLNDNNDENGNDFNCKCGPLQWMVSVVEVMFHLAKCALGMKPMTKPVVKMMRVHELRCIC